MMANQLRQTELETTRRWALRKSRDGVSLVEILMALMVMGVGLVSVATLFPIAMLRSIQATQLTNASLLMSQSQDYFKAFPDLTRNHYDGILRPNYEFTANSVTWIRRGTPTTAGVFKQLPSGLPYTTIIDPIGMLNYSGSGNADEFGSDPHGLHAFGPNFYAVDRTNGGFNLAIAAQRNLAFEVFASRDSWSSYLSSIAVTKNSATELVLTDANAGDFTTFQQMMTDNVPVRAIAVNFAGKESHVSNIASVNSGAKTITLSSRLPNNGLFNAIPEVRLQVFEPRYSSLISVRKVLTRLGADGLPGIGIGPKKDDDGVNGPNDLGEVAWHNSDESLNNIDIKNADLVIFFRRDFSPFSEQVYGVEGMRKASLGATSQPVRIYWDSTKPLSKPALKPGGFVCDPINGYWYKIRSIFDEEGSGTAQVQWIGANNNRYIEIDLETPPQTDTRFLMVYKNIIEVYPISIPNPYKLLIP